MTKELSLPLVTRVEVIDPIEGRAFTGRYGAAGASVHVQDEGRTIKVFAAETQPHDQDARVAIQDVVADALRDAPALLENPEYGGDVVDVVSDRLHAAGIRPGVVRGAQFPKGTVPVRFRTFLFAGVFAFLVAGVITFDTAVRAVIAVIELATALLSSGSADTGLIWHTVFYALFTVAWGSILHDLIRGFRFYLRNRVKG